MTTISSVQDFVCTVCNRRFESRAGLDNHEGTHTPLYNHQTARLPSARTIAIAGGIATAILIAGIIAWRLSRRENKKM